jgi:hypothetical protein
MVRWNMGAVLAGAILILAVSGCAYRLQAPSPPSTHALRLIANSPEDYSIHVQGNVYPVAGDGTVAFKYPAFRRGCNVYLFDLVPIKSGEDPLKTKTISLTKNGRVLQTFSLSTITKLPEDSSGRHVLSLKR